MIEAFNIFISWQLTQYFFTNKQKPIPICCLGWEVNVQITKSKPFAFDTNLKAA